MAQSLLGMKPIFCGNLDYDARQYDLERLFKRYGKVERVDIKSGFAFVYMEDERDAEDAIRRLDQHEFGRKGRRLRVEWTKQDRDNKRSGGGRRPAANDRPSKTLFVINFDPINTRSSDLEKHFELHGKIVNIRIRRNFAFIQFESIEDATRTLEATNMSKLMDRVITVEYATKDDDDRGNGHSPGKRGRDMPPGRGFERRRSPSPYRRERGSPDYGHRRDRDSPDYGHHHRGRNSPDYGHHHRGRNSPDHRGDRNSPDYGHGINRSSRADTRGSADFAGGASPANGKYNRRSPPPRDRSVERSPPPRERLRERSASPRERSPPQRAVRSPPPRERLRERSVSPRERSPPRRSMRSPPPRERLRERSVSPRERLRERSEKLQERSVSPRGRSLSSRERSTEKSSPPREGSPLPREMGEVVE